MAHVNEHYSNQTALRVSLKGDDLDKVLAEHAAKVTGCSLLAENVKVESVRVREADRSQYRDGPTAEISLVVIHSPGAVDAWVERREQEAAERRAEKPVPPPTVEWSPRYRLRLDWRKHLNWGLAVAWLVWAGAVSVKVF